MAVTVIINRAGNGRTECVDTYKDAEHYKVNDRGQLFIFENAGSTGSCFAIYSEGSWLAAFFDERREEHRASSGSSAAVPTRIR